MLLLCSFGTISNTKREGMKTDMQQLLRSGKYSYKMDIITHCWREFATRASQINPNQFLRRLSLHNNLLHYPISNDVHPTLARMRR